MIRPDHLTKHVIAPVLRYLGDGLYSEAAVRLLLGTAAVESELGTYLFQHPNGPAMGIYQIEPATDWDVHQHYLRFRPDLERQIKSLYGSAEADAGHPLVTNLGYQTAIARLIYKRDPRPLPAAGDIDGLAATWKRAFNTPKGKGTVEKFLDTARRLKLFDAET